MIVLDTNVVSELMKDRPQPEVLAWVDDQLADALFITTITEAEIRAGIAVLPDGQRRATSLLRLSTSSACRSPNAFCPLTARLRVRTALSRQAAALRGVSSARTIA